MMDAKDTEHTFKQIRLVLDSGTLHRCVGDIELTGFPDFLPSDDDIDQYTSDQLNTLLLRMRNQILIELSSLLSRLVTFAGERIVCDLGSDISHTLLSSGYTDSLSTYPIETLNRELLIMQTVRECIAASLR